MPGPGSQAVPKPTFTKDKRQVKRDKTREWQAIRRAVLIRDGYHCRVCGNVWPDVHHIRLKSAGGKDSTANCVCLCRVCHSDIHGYRLALSGDANKKLRIERLR